MNKINTYFNKMEDLLASIAGLLMLFSMFSTILEVFMRYFFNHSFVWIQEYNEYILLYIPFLAGAWLLRLNGHVAIDLIDNFIKSNSKRVLSGITAVIGIIVTAIIVYASILVTIHAYESNLTSTTILQTPQFYVYIIIPIGTLFMLIEFCRQFIQISKNSSN